MENSSERKFFRSACVPLKGRLFVATKHPAVGKELKEAGVRVIDRTKHIRMLLRDHPKLPEVLQLFSPQLWRQQLHSQLQRMGLLSVPKIRILSIAGLSLILFYIVVFQLLPSAEVRIRPRKESVSQTVNIFLATSGAVLSSDRVRRLPLVPVSVHTEKELTFQDVSKEFIGTSATVRLTVINKSSELYSLKKGTRFSNQAGMVFRIKEAAIVDAGAEVTVRAEAEHLDLYGRIIGERGNVPAGLKWEIPGLSQEERLLVYAENRQAATGGTTAYKTVLKQEDLDIAKKRLEQELLAAAKKLTEEKQRLLNAPSSTEYLTMLNYPELTVATYDGFLLPTDLLGQEVSSVAIRGGVTYTMFAYDAEKILSMLFSELEAHVRPGRKLSDAPLTRDNLVVHVIDYADDLSWIKLTVDLTGTEEYILDPLTPTGALFAKALRERIAGLRRDEALRIVKNMPEVESVQIKQWPPWQRALPRLAPHISISSY